MLYNLLMQYMSYYSVHSYMYYMQVFFHYIGTWVGIGMYTLHHDPLVWNDPEVHTCRYIIHTR